MYSTILVQGYGVHVPGTIICAICTTDYSLSSHQGDNRMNKDWNTLILTLQSFCYLVLVPVQEMLIREKQYCTRDEYLYWNSGLVSKSLRYYHSYCTVDCRSTTGVPCTMLQNSTRTYEAPRLYVVVAYARERDKLVSM